MREQRDASLNCWWQNETASKDHLYNERFHHCGWDAVILNNHGGVQMCPCFFKINWLIYIDMYCVAHVTGIISFLSSEFSCGQGKYIQANIIFMDNYLTRFLSLWDFFQANCFFKLWARRAVSTFSSSNQHWWAQHSSSSSPPAAGSGVLQLRDTSPTRRPAAELSE